MTDPRLSFQKYESLQAVLNWFAVALMLAAGVILWMVEAPVTTPEFMVATTVPLLIRLFARRPRAPAGARLLAMSVNWLAAVLVGGLAAAAFTGIGGTYALFPLLGCAAFLYYWNAVGLALTCLGEASATVAQLTGAAKRNARQDRA